jgi:hypothetical protein
LGDKSSRRSSVISVGSKTSAPEVHMAESTPGQVAEIVNSQTGASEQPKGSTDIKRRPSMPGQFDSYALDSSELPTPAPDPQPMREIADRAFAKREKNVRPQETPELAPTTAVRKLDGKDSSVGAMASLAAAGAAMGEAIRRSLSVDRGDKPLQPSSSTKRETGDILSNKPLAPQTVDPKASPLPAIPPTPPVKDNGDISPIPLKPNPLVPSLTKRAPTEPSGPAQDTTGNATSQSDVAWLSDEIDRSLTPTSHAGPGVGSKENSYIVSPVSAGSDNTEVGPSLQLNKRFSWESSNISAAQSQLDIINPAVAASTVDEKSTAIERPTTPDNARFNGDGLHVINSQPGELPKNATDPMFNLDSTLEDPEVTPKDKGKSKAVENVALGAGIVGAGAAVAAVTASSSSEPEHIPAPPAKDLSETRPSPTTPMAPPAGHKDLMSFREIQAIKSSPDRIATYNTTRTNWSSADSGLHSWISSTLVKYPEHESIKQDAAAPLMTSPYDNSRGNRHLAGSAMDPIVHLPETPQKDKRTSSGAGKAVADGLRGLGGKGKGLLERINRGRLRGSDGVGN